MPLIIHVYSYCDPDFVAQEIIGAFFSQNPNQLTSSVLSHVITNHFESHYILTIGQKIICKLIFIKKENQIHEFHDFLLLSEKQSNRQSDVGQIIKEKTY